MPPFVKFGLMAFLSFLVKSHNHIPRTAVQGVNRMIGDAEHMKIVQPRTRDM